MGPGTRVRENEIAERLGISRTPVRGALRGLEAEGPIVHLPHQRAVIAELDNQPVTDRFAAAHAEHLAEY